MSRGSSAARSTRCARRSRPSPAPREAGPRARGLKRRRVGDPSAMAKDEPDRPQDRSEDEQEPLNRQMMEPLNELRVAMPGVQVLFGFLLTVPFQQRFQRVTDFQETVYFVTLIAAAVATAFLIAPSAYHRLMLGQHDKPNIIHLGSAQLVVGLSALARSED